MTNYKDIKLQFANLGKRHHLKSEKMSDRQEQRACIARGILLYATCVRTSACSRAISACFITVPGLDIELLLPIGKHCGASISGWVCCTHKWVKQPLWKHTVLVAKRWSSLISSKSFLPPILALKMARAWWSDKISMIRNKTAAVTLNGGKIFSYYLQT